MKYLSADNWAAGNLSIYVFFPAKQRGILQCWINDESIDDQHIPNCENFQILHTNAKWLGFITQNVKLYENTRYIDMSNCTLCNAYMLDLSCY